MLRVWRLRRRKLRAVTPLAARWWGPALALAVLAVGAPGANGPGRLDREAALPTAAVSAKTVAKAAASVGFRLGRLGWAGSWKVDGTRAFSIDLDSRDPSTAGGFSGATARSVRRQVGWTKDHKGGAAAVKGAVLTAKDLAALAYLADRYASSPKASMTAAAEHAVRSLTAGDRVQAEQEKARWASVVGAHPRLKDRYDGVAADLHDHLGPYTVTTTWVKPPTALTPGALAVQVLSAAGRPMAGVRLDARTPTTPAPTTSTNPKGSAVVAVPATAKGPLTVTVTANGLPGPAPLLYTPARYRDRRSADSLAARMVAAGPRRAVTGTATADVAGVLPVVTARAKPASPALGSRVTNDVTLTRTAPAYAGTITASLWGPFPAPPTAGSCDPATGPLAGRGSADAKGNSTVSIPGITVASAGYYTWTVDVAASALQDEVVTACAVPAQTFSVAGAPALSLAVTGNAVPGDDLDVRLAATGTFPGLAADATVTLYGPFTSRPGPTSCTKRVAVDAETVTLVGDGTVTAGSIPAGATGWYTWAATLPAVPRTQAAASVPCATAGATFAVTRPAIGPLDVTGTGSVGATDPGPAPPPGGPLLTIGPGKVVAPLVPVPLNPPGIAVPSDYSLAGQVDAAGHVGDTFGTVVVAGRVGDVHGARGALYALPHVAVGDKISLTDVNGLTGAFRVDSVTTRPRIDVLPASLFDQTGPLRLVILSTTDPVPFGVGLITYRSHVIVTATAL